MGRIQMVLLAACIGFLPALSARADFSTAFIEINNKVGDVSEAAGHVVDLGDETTPILLVIVSSDRGQFHILRAEAGPGVIKKDLLSKDAYIKAQIVESAAPSRHGKVRILEMRSITSGPMQRPRPPTTAPAR